MNGHTGKEDWDSFFFDEKNEKHLCVKRIKHTKNTRYVAKDWMFYDSFQSHIYWRVYLFNPRMWHGIQQVNNINNSRAEWTDSNNNNKKNQTALPQRVIDWYLNRQYRIRRRCCLFVNVFTHNLLAGLQNATVLWFLICSRVNVGRSGLFFSSSSNSCVIWYFARRSWYLYKWWRRWKKKHQKKENGEARRNRPNKQNKTEF